MKLTEFKIDKAGLGVLKDEVVVLTGGSSGIGLATVDLLLSVGAKVVSGDRNPPPKEHENLLFVKVDVTSWTDLSGLFKEAAKKYGRIDHVFANAGIGSTTTLMDEKLDEAGELLEPNHRTMDVNLKGVINTTALALHYLRKQQKGGSIVLSASASSFQRFNQTDYTTAKHGVLGLMRSLVPHLPQSSTQPSIRINAISPSWTSSGLVPTEILKAAGVGVQGPEVVAESVALLMSDKARHGQLIYSSEGRFSEIEEGLLLTLVPIINGNEPSEEDAMGKIEEKAREAGLIP